MSRSQYLTGDMSHRPRFTTALGVLLDGKANCQGYTDAFYMLGRMMGWNVGRMSGKAGGGGHAWNTITFEDGKTYFVDATWGDKAFGEYKNRNYNGYIYLNAPIEIMQVTHSWDGAVSPPNLQASVDDRYGYCCFGSNLARRSTAEAGLNFLAQKLKETDWASVIVPLDEKYIDEKGFLSSANKVANESGKNITLIYKKYGKYLFFFARQR